MAPTLMAPEKATNTKAAAVPMLRLMAEVWTGRDNQGRWKTGP